MSRRESALRQPLIGLTFVVLLVGAVVLAIVDYSGGFVSRDEVTLYASQAGNQLSRGAQVKLHGVVVGSVESLGVRGKDAALALRALSTHVVGSIMLERAASRAEREIDTASAWPVDADDAELVEALAVPPDRAALFAVGLDALLEALVPAEPAG